MTLGSFTDEETDNEPIPFFLLPDGSQKIKKSPLMSRTGSPPHIQLVSLKNFSGLENVRAGQLSGQDSVDSIPHRLRQHQAPSTDRGGPVAAAAAAGERHQGGGMAGDRIPGGAVAGERYAVGGTAGERFAAAGDRDGERPNISILEENKVKIQVPGLPVNKHSTSSKHEDI